MDRPAGAAVTRAGDAAVPSSNRALLMRTADDNAGRVLAQLGARLEEIRVTAVAPA
jgi:hypothetical protein